MRGGGGPSEGLTGLWLEWFPAAASFRCLPMFSAAPALCTPNPRGRLVFLCCSPSLGGRGPVSQASILSPPPPPTPPAAGEGNSALSPLNPGELLIALHNIDSAKCDMKSIIKGEAHPPPSRPPSSVAWPLRTWGRTLGWSRPPLESAKTETVLPTAPSQSSGHPASLLSIIRPLLPSSPTPSKEVMHPLCTSTERSSGRVGDPPSPAPWA